MCTIPSQALVRCTTHFPRHLYGLHLLWQKTQDITMTTTARMMSKHTSTLITMTAVRSLRSSREVAGAEVCSVPHSGSRRELTTTGRQDSSTARVCPPMTSSGLPADHTSTADLIALAVSADSRVGSVTHT